VVECAVTLVGWLTLAGWLILAVLVGVPAYAWVTWYRRPKPRPVPLLVISSATTIPPVVALAGTARVFILVGTIGHDAVSDKARILAESVSEMMNCTAFAVMASIAVSLGAPIVSRFKRGKARG
jgi:hypothetical protein